MPRVTDWTNIARTSYGYRVRVLVRPHPEESKRFPRNTPLAVMQRWRDKTKARLQKLRTRHAPGTLAADVETYLREWPAGKHPQTVAQRTRLLWLWADAFPDRSRDDLTTAMIRSQLAHWRTHGLPEFKAESEYGERPPPGRLSPETYNKVRQALYQLFAYYQAGEEGAVNPVAAIPTERPPEREPRSQEPEVWRAIFAHMPRSKTKARLQVMLYAGGLRPEEVRRIRPTDWDGGHAWYVRTAKRGVSATVPLTTRGRAALRYFWRLKAFGDFTSPPMARMLKEAQVRAGLERLDIVPYDARHSFGTYHYRAFRDFAATQTAMRHSSPAMTVRYTRAAVPAVQIAATQALDSALKASRRAGKVR